MSIEYGYIIALLLVIMMGLTFAAILYIILLWEN